MLARSPALICATTVTCMLLVGGDRIAEYNELFANAGMPDLTTAQMKDFAQEVKDSSTVEEKQILNTLLQERLSWHPEAPELLTQVVKRGRRLAVCHSMRKMAECEGMKKGCGGCKWKNSSMSSGSCNAPRCDDYKDSTSCCANGIKVDEGCFWQKTNKKNIPKCVPMSCDTVADGHCSGFGADCPEAKTACLAQKGCKYFDNVGKCVGSNTECTGDKSSSRCSTSNGMSPTTFCPLTTCTMCFSLCLTSDCTAEYKKELEGKCKDTCDGIAHCVEEVNCLKRSNGKCDQKGSCLAELVFPKPITTCAGSCALFDKSCQTCGAKSNCTIASRNSTGNTCMYEAGGQKCSVDGVRADCCTFIQAASKGKTSDKKCTAGDSFFLMNANCTGGNGKKCMYEVGGTKCSMDGVSADCCTFLQATSKGMISDKKCSSEETKTSPTCFSNAPTNGGNGKKCMYEVAGQRCSLDGVSADCCTWWQAASKGMISDKKCSSEETKISTSCSDAAPTIASRNSTGNKCMYEAGGQKCSMDGVSADCCAALRAASKRKTSDKKCSSEDTKISPRCYSAASSDPSWDAPITAIGGITTTVTAGPTKTATSTKQMATNNATTAQLDLSSDARHAAAFSGIFLTILSAVL